MASEKLQRTIQSVNEHLFSLRNGECSRDTGLGTSWSKIRIGMRFGFAADGTHGDIAQADGTAMHFGLLASPTSQYGGGSASHFVGIFVNTPTIHYRSDLTPEIYRADEQNDLHIKKVESGAETDVGSIGASTNQLTLAGVVPTNLGLAVLEFEKGSPWTIRVLIRGAHKTLTALEDYMVAPSPSFSYSGTVSVDEATHGNLTAMTVYWPNSGTHYLELTNFQTSLIA